MDVIKRNGSLQLFSVERIENAITAAARAETGRDEAEIASAIAEDIELELKGRAVVDISEIEKMVYEYLIAYGLKNVAKAYEDYRSVREYQRKNNTIDQKVLGIINGNDPNIKDNSNKKTQLISTMRDLVAEEVSKDISLRMLLPPDIAAAHNEGLIYIHDLGHYLNKSLNCCLVNLDDMLQNGTCINGKLITKPHSFRTACTIATQIVAQVASGQFGGQTITLTHLAPFVRDSRERILDDVRNEALAFGKFDASDEKIDEIVDKRLKKEIEDGIQTFQYQINTLQTSNGQAPFLSVLMYIEDGSEYEKETAMLVEEMLRQRLQGMKNEVGVYISPAFPKLLYVTDENNIYEGSKYFYITKLAAECIAHRMMPDCLSAKKLRENYGDVVAPMGK